MASRWQTRSWRRELAGAFTDPAALLAHLGVANRHELVSEQAHARFPMHVPRGFATLMEPGNPDDPLLRQVLPSAAELDETPGFVPDPVGDRAARAAPGLLCKYAGRALLLTTSACAGHCRYCFRRHGRAFEHRVEGRAMGETRVDAGEAALEWISASDDVDEVILSGGDPLMLSDTTLASLIDRLAAIPHLRRVRLHSRIPVLLPSRITTALVSILSGTRLALVVVCHINHPREIGADSAAALARLRAAAAALLNQSVLLAGVNDDTATLSALSKALFDNGVLPYYLHQLDRVQGAAHFEVSDEQALELSAGLRRSLPGYLVPRLVREPPGAPCKQPVGELSPTRAPSRDDDPSFIIRGIGR